MDYYFITFQPDPCQRKGIVKVVPYKSESWDGDWEHRYYPQAKKDFSVSAFRIYEEPIEIGEYKIYYHWELAGPGGASFFLFIPPGCPREIVTKAKNQIRRSQDVVSMYTYRCTKMEWLESAPDF